MSARKSSEEKIGSIPPFGLRLLPELKQRLEDAAAANGVSLNREITMRLEQSFEAVDASIGNAREIARAVMEEMREEAKVSRAMPMLLQWFDSNPEERAAYEALPPDEREDYLANQAQALWLDHLNEERSKAETTRPRMKKVRPPK